MSVLIGSKALYNNGVSLNKEFKDFDYMVTQKEYDEFIVEHKDSIVHIKPTRFGNAVLLIGKGIYEFEIVDNRSTQIFYDKYNHSNYDYTADLDGLYTLKMSHRFLRNSPHFKKTMSDIHLLRNLGASIPNDLKEFYRLRMKETYNYPTPKLARNKVDFFENVQEGYTNQTYMVYDHDTIHEAIKLYDKPAYDYIKVDEADVLCSKDLWASQPENIKLATVYEEACVLALERHQIPNNFTPDPRKSFLIALEKICTSVASGWWREYALENYYNVVALYDNINYNNSNCAGNKHYVDLFHQARNDGKLKLWKDVIDEQKELV